MIKNELLKLMKLHQVIKTNNRCLRVEYKLAFSIVIFFINVARMMRLECYNEFDGGNTNILFFSNNCIHLSIKIECQ